jgi:hypothetical protein
VKLTILAFVFASANIFAQTAPAPATAPTVASPLTQSTSVVIGTTNVNTSALPGITLGVGGVWNRGQADPFGIDTTLSIRLNAASNIYSWTDVLTPYNSAHAPGPIYSTVTTGAAWVVAQNKTGSVSLVLIGQAGFSTSTAGTSPAFTGSVGAAFKLGKSNTYVFPYFKAAAPTLGASGAVASFIMQPGVQFLYGFGK